MNGYQMAYQDQGGYSSSASDQSCVKTYGLAGVFVPSLASAYPSITDELKKDVAILAKSLEVRERYIDDLRETRDKLARKLDIKEMQIGYLERDIKRYQQFFYKTEEHEKEQ
jgi:hypothetical protein